MPRSLPQSFKFQQKKNLSGQMIEPKKCQKHQKKNFFMRTDPQNPHIV